MTQAFTTLRLLCAMGLITMSACIPLDQQESENEVKSDLTDFDDPNCGPERIEDFIGKHVSTLPKDITDGHIRIIPPNSAVTMDYIPTRLNISTDADGIILKAYCG